MTPPPTSLPNSEPAPTRNVILLSTRLGPATTSQVAVESGDVVAVDVELASGEQARILLETTILPPLLAATPRSSLVLVAGNFNLSHPNWDESVDEPDDEAERAVRTFVAHNLTHFLPPNTPTYYPHTKSHPPKPLNLVLGSLRAEDRVVSCGIADDLESGSHHRPVRLVLALETVAYTPPPRRAFRRTDPELLERAFRDATAHLPTPPILTSADIDQRAAELTNALQIAISAATPFARARAG
ncbi:hypothetical protein NBRC10512v2_006966 [Rhodotorula toruloides]|uniref:RHTO0S01e00518g1_1 n=2 Tax=Rhodotorula toruloides TaxID=5286 RepID=A0A061ADA4_RHOTO|nr:Endonuclease/exonuclease/phosphatase domain containing protein [Rhodotorula toruloides NP11]EMS18076.1 Endonuclease/exonuclease/phosphatase domain containing protein [Rhodotorula toruloides NP11]CDR35493.1 RHTO0S01e00518g1_1 [Rhodotorula toruloides]